MYDMSKKYYIFTAVVVASSRAGFIHCGILFVTYVTV